MVGFVDSTGTADLPHVLDLDGALWDRFGVTTQRTYIFIDGDGSSVRGTYGNLPGDIETNLLAS